MNKMELNQLVEELIRIRDFHRYELDMEELDSLAKACNLIYKNIEKLKDDAA